MALTGTNTAEKTWNYLLGIISNEYGVAALMGNLDAESGLNPKNLQDSSENRLSYTDDTYTAAVDSGKYTNFANDSAGYGIAQWTYCTRKKGLLDHVRSAGKSIGDLECQLVFLIKELSTSYKSVFNALKTATSIKTASDTVLKDFEKPKIQSEKVKEERAAKSQKYFDLYSKGKVNSMSVLIGHASISEDGTVNGTKGDQTGKEVCTREWYSKPWDFAAIHPDANVREKHASSVEDGCANDNIGYGQGDRNTLNTEAKKVNYDLSKIATPCNTDCSEFQNVCAVASGAPGVTHASNGWTTSTMKAALQAAGYKIVTDKTYLASADYCVRGAIYVKTGSHTVCGLTNGAKAAQMLSKAGISGISSGSTSSAAGGTIAVGTIVNFTGAKHYTSANAASAKTCKPGQAKITAVSEGAAHPYHLVHTDSTSNVYGWVDVADIGGTAAGSASNTKTHTVVKSDTLSAIASKNGTTVAKIVEANKGKYPKIATNYIVIGWTLNIPQ